MIEECQAQRRRLSQMQQEERREKAQKLAAIRQRLQRALEIEEVTFFCSQFKFDKQLVSVASSPRTRRTLG